jgi:hypothetical protein
MGPIHKSAVVLGPLLRPDRSHGFNALLHQLMARRESCAVVSHLLLVPAIANTEQKAPTRELVDCGDVLCCLDGITLINHTDAGAELECLRAHRGCGQREKGVHDVGLLPSQLAGIFRRREMRML